MSKKTNPLEASRKTACGYEERTPTCYSCMYRAATLPTIRPHRHKPTAPYQQKEHCGLHAFPIKVHGCCNYWKDTNGDQLIDESKIHPTQTSHNS